MQKLKNTEYVWSRLKETFFLNKREGQKENKKAKLSVGLDTEWKNVNDELMVAKYSLMAVYLQM